MQGYESSPAHRSNQSLSLQAPGGILPPSQNVNRARRMTVGSQSSLSLPDGGRQPSPRPPSPLRNSFTMNTSTGIDHDVESDDESDEEGIRIPRKWKKSPSPSSSVSNLAASFVQRVNTFVGGIAPKSPNMLSDAELEAEAERERERSRREAEAILMREAQQRKQVEERMLAMMDNAKGLPPPPSSHSHTIPTTPSPGSSYKDTGGWWQAAKNRLTPVKDRESPITPAQQVILDAKAKEKTDPPPTANLNIPLQPPTRKPVPASPSSPTPSRPSLSTPNLSPSPMRQTDSLANSPSREAPPVYVSFTPQGTVDVPVTLLAIAKRFEKLEKWTIGHVRALEDRMNDVERWLVEKENLKDEDKSNSSKAPQESLPAVGQELTEIRDEISELQGRVGELGREMAKMATAPSNLSSGPKTQTVQAAVSVAPRQASTTLVHEAQSPTIEASVAEVFTTPRHTRLPSSARESTSPPLASARTPSGTRLPYPTGDYNSPPETFSPTGSPNASLNSKRRGQSISSISGLPSHSYAGISAGAGGSPISSVFNIASTLTGRPLSPPSGPSAKANPIATTTTATITNTNRTSSPIPIPTKNTGLPPPKSTAPRQGSVSPTPRKRYTVALGGPIVAPPSPPDAEENPPASSHTSGRRLPATPKSSARTIPESDDEEEEEDGGETIGKSASARFTRKLTVQKKRSNTSISSVSSIDQDVLRGTAPPTRKVGGDFSSNQYNTPTLGSQRRMKAQSVYGMSSFINSSANSSTSNVGTPATTTTSTTKTNVTATFGTSPGTTAPLRLRSKSSDRLNSDAGFFSGSTPPTPNSAKFVDPLLLRRKQEVAAGTPGGANAGGVSSKGKLAVNQLVAFFDKDKDKRGRR
ncbi:hypothetical protein D9611_011119 [Ephemerocybe angulata]|uniref:Uncharacterized protein n=1 Tax=Ephemerocybe angulata TaxID=980116 RepID=A0A8H5FJX9_9AGAR|nr:hypothetical protein D9611_011119 [Tulosesus angulatus]